MVSVWGTIDRIAPTRRPDMQRVGFQRWTNLLFVHWRVAPSEIAPLVPEELSIDTFDGSAWVGLVPFHLSQIGPAWWPPWLWYPPLSGLNKFHETNLRTYVHRDGAEPGVWFFSLDAASTPAVKVARRRWHLPYHRADMKLKRNGSQVHYQSERLWPGQYGAHCRIKAEVGELLPALDRRYPPGQAVPGTLEHFLAERYILYSSDTERQIHRAYVHHKPYPLRDARLLEIDQTLLKAENIEPPGDWEHTLFCDEVDVDIFELQPVAW